MKENLIFKHSNLCYEKNIPSVIDTIICLSYNIHFLKKDKEDNATKTKIELLTTGTWKLISYTSTPAYDWYGNGVYATDIFAVLDPCEADGFDTYKVNGILR